MLSSERFLSLMLSFYHSCRERYNDLLKQCQMMHSSVGTGSLAYVVGSKVMDMRKSYKKEVVKESTDGSTEASVNDNEKTENHGGDSSNNDTDTSHGHRRGSSSESVDIVSGRESPESTPFVADGVFDFPSLAVTDLFGRSSLDKKGVSTPDEEASVRSELRSEDEGMHSFRIDKNADLVIESSYNNNRSASIHSEIEVVHPESAEQLSHSGSTVEIVDGLRISDVPEMPSAKETPSRGGTVTEDRMSEWLWTLHRIGTSCVESLMFLMVTTPRDQ